VLGLKRFHLVWSADGWHTTHTSQSRSLGSSGFSADIPPQRGENTPHPAPADSSQIAFTFFWPEENRWLGHNHEIRIKD